MLVPMCRFETIYYCVNVASCHTYNIFFSFKKSLYTFLYLPKKVEQMYSEIWLPDLLDSEKWLSSLLSIRLNWKNERRIKEYIQGYYKLQHDLTFGAQYCTAIKVEKILKGSLDLIPSPSLSVKVQIVSGKVCLRCKGKTLLGVVNKLLKTKSLLTSFEKKTKINNTF